MLMLRRVCAMAVVAIALSACSSSPPPELMKQGASKEDFTKDLAACKASSGDNVMGCMKSRGWVEYMELKR